MKIENVDIRINDIDHIWYNNKQYISLNRVNQMLRDKRTQTHSCDCGRKETHGDVIYRADAIDALKGLLDSMLETDAIGFYEVENVLYEVPSAEPKILSETDLIELRDRFGDYVEFVVRDMISRKGERWKRKV